MDFNQFFRGFFGINRMNRDKFDGTFSDHHFNNWNEDNTDEEGSRDDFESFFDDGFSSVLQQVEDMFSNMFSIHSGFLDFPNLEMPHDHANPRDIMLREPGEGNCKKGLCFEEKGELVDSDLDEKVAKAGLSSLEDGITAPRRIPEIRSFRKSITSKIIRSADGVIEEHRTVTDNDGKTVTTIKKSVGDQTYQVITESDKNGMIEKKEDFINIDEKDIPQFEEKFSGSRNFFPILERPQTQEMIPDAPPGDSKYLSIFKRLFS